MNYIAIIFLVVIGNLLTEKIKKEAKFIISKYKEAKEIKDNQKQIDEIVNKLNKLDKEFNNKFTRS